MVKATATQKSTPTAEDHYLVAVELKESVLRGYEKISKRLDDIHIRTYQIIVGEAAALLGFVKYISAEKYKYFHYKNFWSHIWFYLIHDHALQLMIISILVGSTYFVAIILIYKLERPYSEWHSDSLEINMEKANKYPISISTLINEELQILVEGLANNKKKLEDDYEKWYSRLLRVAISQLVFLGIIISLYLTGIFIRF